MRHLTNVFEGLLKAHPKHFVHGEQLVHLWLHESERVYGDRLVSCLVQCPTPRRPFPVALQLANGHLLPATKWECLRSVVRSLHPRHLGTRCAGETLTGSGASCLLRRKRRSRSTTARVSSWNRLHWVTRDPGSHSYLTFPLRGSMSKWSPSISSGELLISISSVRYSYLYTPPL